jgi:hypothetical protein
MEAMLVIHSNMKVFTDRQYLPTAKHGLIHIVQTHEREQKKPIEVETQSHSSRPLPRVFKTPSDASTFQLSSFLLPFSFFQR